ncbi:MAG: hypothetical protein ACKVOU_15035, partial [Cytophagales bacterium]
MTKIAIDTNILLYSIDKDNEFKRKISIELIEQNPFIFNQNLSEFINVLLNRWKYPKGNLSSIIAAVLDSCVLV